jgi:hypothetical protein
MFRGLDRRSCTRARSRRPFATSALRGSLLRGERAARQGQRNFFRTRMTVLLSSDRKTGLGRLGDGYGRVTREVIRLIWTILALACIVLGFVGKIIDQRILLGTLEWFVAAIAFNTLGSLPFVKKR